MAHGGYDKRRDAVRKPVNRRSKGLGVEKKKPPKTASLKNQIRSTERMLLRKNLPLEVKEAQQEKLDGLKRLQDDQTREAENRKQGLRDRKIKFFERRKIERRLRRLEKQQRASSGPPQEADAAQQLSKLKEDLEYVRFFPKGEKYVPLFTGGDDLKTVDNRNEFRKKIKAKIVAAAASGKEPEETGSEDDAQISEDDDFFLAGSSSDEADADDEWTDKSAREQISSASGRATSGMSSDEKNQKPMPARALMRPPRPLPKYSTNSVHPKSRFGGSSSKNSSVSSVQRVEMSTFTNGASSSRNRTSFENVESSNLRTSNSSNLSSNSDAHKPRRKRRPKKKRQQ